MRKIFVVVFTLLLTTMFTQANTKTIKHKVKRGETLYTIAHNNHTTVKKLCKVNGLKQTSIIRYGTVLKVPAKYKVAKSTKKRSVKFVNIRKPKKKKDVIAIAKQKLGKRYVWGASGYNNTYDCSSFVKYVYRQQGIDIPRTSYVQAKHGKYIPRKNLKKGDLIFFDTSKHRKGYVNHVGMYIGHGKFIHASSAKKKVIISSLKKKFYSQRYRVARRPV